MLDVISLSGGGCVGGEMGGWRGGGREVWSDGGG